MMVRKASRSSLLCLTHCARAFYNHALSNSTSFEASAAEPDPPKCMAKILQGNVEPPAVRDLVVSLAPSVSEPETVDMALELRDGDVRGNYTVRTNCPPFYAEQIPLLLCRAFTTSCKPCAPVLYHLPSPSGCTYRYFVNN